MYKLQVTDHPVKHTEQIMDILKQGLTKLNYDLPNRIATTVAVTTNLPHSINAESKLQKENLIQLMNNLYNCGCKMNLKLLGESPTIVIPSRVIITKGTWKGDTGIIIKFEDNRYTIAITSTEGEPENILFDSTYFKVITTEDSYDV